MYLKTLRYRVISGTIYPATRRNIPKDLHFQATLVRELSPANIFLFATGLSSTKARNVFGFYELYHKSGICIFIYRSQWPRGVRHAIRLIWYDHTYFEYLSFLGQFISPYNTSSPPLCSCACLTFSSVGRPCDGPIPRPGVLPNVYKKDSEMRNTVLQHHRDRQTERYHIYATQCY